jgi:hypothetical protein
MKEQTPHKTIKKGSLEYRKTMVKSAIAQQTIEGIKPSSRAALRDLNLIAKGQLDVEIAINNLNKRYKVK